MIRVKDDMAGKQFSGDALASNIAGLSKTQLYDIMSQMKNLIEQNQEQARHILIQNPLLTRALFQAQIMLGMVQPSSSISNIQPQTSQQSTSQAQQTVTHMTQSLPGQVAPQEKTNIAPDSNPVRKQNQPSVTMPSSALQSMPSAYQSRSQLTQSSGLQAMPLHQPSIPPHSSQLQLPMQTSGVSHLPLQPPLPPQPRPPTMASGHQYSSHLGPNMNFQHPGPSQSPFNSGVKQQPGALGPSFPHGQPQLPNQQPQSLYQLQGGGPAQHLGPMEYNNNNAGANSMQQMERGSQRAPSEHSGGSSQLPGLPPPPPPQQQLPAHAQAAGNPPRPPLIPPEMEQVLLQQVMSLTPEQINMLPPEQRNQVLQLQRMLR